MSDESPEAQAEAAVHAAFAAAPHKPTRAQIEATIQQWWGEQICNSPVSRTTDGVNHLSQVAIPDLINRLSSL